MENQDNLVPWYAKATSNLMGVKFVSSAPVLAGASSGLTVVDVTDRELPLSEPPMEAFFFNLRPDREIQREYSSFRFDYIVGNSDAENDSVRRLDPFDMIYWTTINHGHVFDLNQAVLVRACDSSLFEHEAEIDRNWLCLRRVGNEDNIVFDDDQNVFLRSKRADGEIEVEAINPNLIQGYIFAKHKITNKKFVRAAASVPFYKSAPIDLSATHPKIS